MTETKPDDLTGRIDDAIDSMVGNTEQAPAGGDEPTGIEKRLRLLCPGHTYWRRASGVPQALAEFVKQIGAEIVGVERAPERIAGVWSTPTGVWMLTVQTCAAGDGDTYHVKVDGPDTELEREHLTEDQVVNLLGAVGAITL